MTNTPEIKKFEGAIKRIMPEKAEEIAHKYANVYRELGNKIGEGLMTDQDVSPLVQANDYLNVSRDALIKETEKGTDKENLKQLVSSFESDLDNINHSLLDKPTSAPLVLPTIQKENFEDKLPANIRGKGFYEENGKLKRKGMDGEYTLLADGTLAYFEKVKNNLLKSYIGKNENFAYLNGGTYQFLRPNGDMEKDWSPDPVKVLNGTEKDWSSNPVHALNGFYLENGKIRRKGKEGHYELMNDGTLIYYYPNNGGFGKLDPGKDINTDWYFNETALMAQLGLGGAKIEANPEFEALMDLFAPEQKQEMLKVLVAAQLSAQEKINNRLMQIALLTEAFKGAALNIARDNGRKTAFEQLYQFFYEFDETTQKRIKDLEGAVADLKKVAIEVVKNPGDSLNELYSPRVLALMKQYDLDGDDYNFMNRSGEVVDAANSHDTLQRQTLSTVDYLIEKKRYEQASNLIAGTMLFPHFQKAGEYFGANQQKIKWAVEEGAPPFDSLSGVEKQALQRFKKLQGIGEISPAQWDKIIDGTIEALPYMLGAGLAAGVGRKVLGEGAKWVAGNWLTRYGLSVSTEFLAGEVMATSNLGRIIYFAGSGAGLLAEGAIFEAAYQGLNGQNLFASDFPEWGRKILLSAATLGAFHIAGKGAEVLNIAIAKGLTKVAPGTVQATIQKLLISNNLQAATMLYMGAAEHGLVHGGDSKDFNWTEQILHAYAMAGALTVSGKMVEVAGKNFVPALKNALREKPSLEKVPAYKRAIQSVRSSIEGLANTPLGLKIGELKENLRKLRVTVQEIMADAKRKISAMDARLSTGRKIQPGERQALLNQITAIRDSAKQKAEALRQEAKGLDQRIKEMDGTLAKERDALEEKLARLEGQLKGLEARVLDPNTEGRDLGKSDKIARDLVSGKFEEGVQAIEKSKGFPLSANQVLAILGKLNYSQRLSFLNLCKRKMTMAEKGTIMNEINVADLKAADLPADWIMGETPVDSRGKEANQSSPGFDIDFVRTQGWRAYLLAAFAAIQIGDAVVGKDSVLDARPAAVRFEAGDAAGFGKKFEGMSEAKAGSKYLVVKNDKGEAGGESKELPPDQAGKFFSQEFGADNATILEALAAAGASEVTLGDIRAKLATIPEEARPFIRLMASLDGDDQEVVTIIDMEGISKIAEARMVEAFGQFEGTDLLDGKTPEQVVSELKAQFPELMLADGLTFLFSLLPWAARGTKALWLRLGILTIPLVWAVTGMSPWKLINDVLGHKWLPNGVEISFEILGHLGFHGYLIWYLYDSITGRKTKKSKLGKQIEGMPSYAQRSQILSDFEDLTNDEIRQLPPDVIKAIAPELRGRENTEVQSMASTPDRVRVKFDFERRFKEIYAEVSEIFLSCNFESSMQGKSAFEAVIGLIYLNGKAKQLGDIIAKIDGEIAGLRAAGEDTGRYEALRRTHEAKLQAINEQAVSLSPKLLKVPQSIVYIPPATVGRITALLRTLLERNEPRKINDADILKAERQLRESMRREGKNQEAIDAEAEKLKTLSGSEDRIAEVEKAILDAIDIINTHPDLRGKVAQVKILQKELEALTPGGQRAKTILDLRQRLNDMEGEVEAARQEVAGTMIDLDTATEGGRGHQQAQLVLGEYDALKRILDQACGDNSPDLNSPKKIAEFERAKAANDRYDKVSRDLRSDLSALDGIRTQLALHPIRSNLILLALAGLGFGGLLLARHLKLSNDKDKDKGSLSDPAPKTGEEQAKEWQNKGDEKKSATDREESKVEEQKFADLVARKNKQLQQFPNLQGKGFNFNSEIKRFMKEGEFNGYYELLPERGVVVYRSFDGKRKLFLPKGADPSIDTEWVEKFPK